MGLPQLRQLDIVISFCSILPAPVQPVYDRDYDRKQREVERDNNTIIAQAIAPPYGQRRGWVPRVVTDYGGNT